ncbi:3-oxoacyl-ACP synthase [Synergistales bacterium]|nr:3-oxoacyl-ACP synthase [Synergistales bacterium]
MMTYIKDVAYYLPPNKVTNEDLKARFPSWNAKRAEKVTGVRERYVENPELAASDMSLIASQRLFDAGRVSKDDIDFVLLVTQSGDYRYPCTAGILQYKLGLGNSVGAFDINLGCSGFVYGLLAARSLVASGAAKNVLLATVEKTSFLCHKSDAALAGLFSDAAAATVVSSDGGIAAIGEFDVGTDGSGYDYIYIPVGGSAMPQADSASPESPIAGEAGSHPEFANMKGLEVFDFSVKSVPITISKALERNKTDIRDIRYFVLHQANKIILDTIAANMGLPSEKMPTNIAEVGNTSSCSIPILLTDLIHGGRGDRLEKGDKLVLCGFGVGLSWGTTVITIQ